MRPTDRTKLKREDLEFVTTAQLAQDSLQLAKFLKPETAGIIAIPRSGLLPASILATVSHLPLFELMPDGNVRQIGSGGRGKFLAKPESPHWLCVDDSSHSGGKIAQAKKQLENYNVSFAVVYALDPSTVDHSVRTLDKVHLFQWNWTNNGIVCGRTYDQRIKGGFGFDMDGVIAQDPNWAHTDKNEQDVIKWIETVKPKFLPRYAEVEMICSFRLEKHRKQSEAWLKKWGVKYKQLILCEARSFKERDEHKNPAVQKAEALKRSTCKLFFESDPRQAKFISDMSGRAVIVPDTGQVFWPCYVHAM